MEHRRRMQPDIVARERETDDAQSNALAIMLP